MDTSAQIQDVRKGTTGRHWAAVFSVALGTFAFLVTNEFLLVGLLGGISRDLAVTDGVADGAVTIPGLTAAIAAPVLDDRCPARRPESRADGD